ncbi:hypothetical protein EJ08DRAFT_704962 [Tothia fuscella]|uniref:Uncharacterized protein n=1 Tax=Tothia fuscella TaxID=1048955 RepID=A0A9P4NX38_9PEZI|nr:hypothetical protein EJ08DRAFT_704962 [Tothia fuscella]
MSKWPSFIAISSRLGQVTNHPPDVQNDPTKYCWLCGYNFPPSRKECPNCDAFVVPTVTPGRNETIGWRLVVFDGQSNQQQRQGTMDLEKPYLTKFDNNFAICSEDKDTGERAILVRQKSFMGLSFKFRKDDVNTDVNADVNTDVSIDVNTDVSTDVNTDVKTNHRTKATNFKRHRNRNIEKDAWEKFGKLVWATQNGKTPAWFPKP